MLKNFAEIGIMPNTARIIRDGIFAPMCSTIPELSSVAWSSIITGKNPAEHGIFGFTDLNPNSYQLKFPNFNNLKAPPFWELCQGQSIIINVPSTYPVRQMNGVHISGFVSIDIEKSIHPKSLIPKLKNLGYRLDVDAQKAHTDLKAFLLDLDQTLTARIKTIEHLWNYTDWQIFMPTFTGTDRLMHFLWSAYEDKDHKYHNDFLNHFRRIDTEIGNLYSRLGDNDIVIILSDHGFEKLEKDVYINYLLAREGFLAYRPKSETKLENIDSATKAFALDPARIYLNRKGKYPAGSLAPNDKNTCLKDLQEMFSSFEIQGKKVIKHVYRKEDIYSGPCLDDAPDLVLIAQNGFNLKGDTSATELTGKGPFTGKHTYQNAFLLINNKDFAPDLPEELSVTDAGKLIKKLTKAQ